MSNIEKPIYLVAIRDEWVSAHDAPTGAVVAFGTRDDADKFVKRAASERGGMPPLFRIVEYSFSGNVFEV